ncbi:hypothetical protein EPI10_002407 [Gossypium australe]|uniref:Uncharacterized protein n=1 Tax=Gossypium australe TaxID=47621 RepID=A0A5B6VE58_9ROSI|nr:hypothetical protein EPI10_002407 [Gossypium australe]
MRSPYTRLEKDSKSYCVNAITIGFHIASNSKHFIMVSMHTQDASANGALLSKTYNEAYEIIDGIATSERRVAGVQEVDALTSLSTQVSSISSMLKQFTINGLCYVAAQPRIHYKRGGPNNNYMQHRSNQPLGFNQQLLNAYIAKNDALIKGQETTLENLENQVGQLANELKSKPQGVVPSNIENPSTVESLNNLENLLKAYMAKNDAT